MKILEVCDSFYPNVDGPIDVIVNLAKEFKRLGLGEVDLLVPEYHKKIEVEGLTIHRCKSVPAGGYRGSVPSLDKRVKRLLSTQNRGGGGYDLIHLHSPFTLAKYALNEAKKHGVPVVITVHTKYLDELKNRIKSKPVRDFVMDYILDCIGNCDVITSVSAGMIDELCAYGFNTNKTVHIIYNSASMPPADSHRAARLRESMNLGDNLAFLFVGRLVKVKNVQFSLEVLSLVKSRGFGNFKFFIAGDGEYAKTLKKLAIRYNLEENVEFLGKITDKALLSDYYAACDALLFPSVFDSFGITVIEAALNGTPAVTIKDSCAAERIKNGENGFSWGYDVNVWAHNLIKLLKDRKAIDIAGKGARENLYLTPEEIALQYHKLYLQTIENFKK